ncbi:DUF4231 domain-containing protein [Nocardia sp. CA2R105]|uniref:DUF4231 domain-containing protein n=1 Tax=Nocardia coffeae TaxID=2873381 RepID=UPI001CA622D9|nr:DUF4231 domain-containing protein [Nocardia coffeae]MBY8859285.1 DUF4231 domain-containing protein [Nocardia coffeae]
MNMIEDSMSSVESGSLLISQLERLRIRAHRAGRAQYMAAHRSSAMHYWLGIPAIVLSTAVGTAVFGTFAGSPNSILTVLTGIVSVGSAVLAALQTFFGYSERSEKHRIMGAKYLALKRKMDLLLIEFAAPQSVEKENLHVLSQFVAEFNDLEESAPNVSDKLYDRARRDQESDIEGI